MKPDFSEQIFEKFLNIKIRPVGAELVNAESQMTKAPERW